MILDIDKLPDFSILLENKAGKMINFIYKLLKPYLMIDTSN